MNRNLTLMSFMMLGASLFAANGGPDSYGYTWKDINEPDGPVYDWVDITTTGIEVTGLGDDNVVGPFTMDTDHPFYWYGRKNVWIGSNGYIAFNNGNIASPFPIIPQAGGVNDYIALMASDLTFAGDGNVARCYFYDNSDITIISYENVPFWTSAAPGSTGSNTFQVILNKVDSTITIQYQQQFGLTQNNDVLVGIESVAGSIGLQHSADVYPTAGFAVRFYPPVQTNLVIADAAMSWNTQPGNGGRFLVRNGTPLALVSNVENTGNVDLSDIQVSGEVRNAANQVQVSGSSTVPFVLASQDADVSFGTSFDPTTAGTYRYTTTLSGIPGELVSINNTLTQELVVVDTTLAIRDLKFTGTTDDGVGLGWDGGNGGVAMYLEPPYYPAYAAATTVRIASNTGGSGFSMKVYDDDGPNGTAGTLLDQVDVAPLDATTGDQVIPLSALLTIPSGGVYVLWYMNGPNVNIAQDIVAPFSLQTYEVLGDTWAEYRDRENVDFHIGLRLTQAPINDVGVSGFFGTAPGQDIVEPITVRTWVTNYGNQPASGFSVSYRFGNDAPVTQNYTGAPIAPLQQTLFSFTQPFDPNITGTGDLCAWSNWDLDIELTNDTNCVSVNVFVGVKELETIAVRTWPNPADQNVFVELPGAGPVSVEVLDLHGRLVRQRAITSSTERLAVPVGDLNVGLYQLRIRQGGTTYSARVLVQH